MPPPKGCGSSGGHGSDAFLHDALLLPMQPALPGVLVWDKESQWEMWLLPFVGTEEGVEEQRKEKQGNSNLKCL